MVPKERKERDRLAEDSLTSKIIVALVEKKAEKIC